MRTLAATYAQYNRHPFDKAHRDACAEAARHRLTPPGHKIALLPALFEYEERCASKLQGASRDVGESVSFFSRSSTRITAGLVGDASPTWRGHH